MDPSCRRVRFLVWLLNSELPCFVAKVLTYSVVRVRCYGITQLFQYPSVQNCTAENGCDLGTSEWRNINRINNIH